MQGRGEPAGYWDIQGEKETHEICLFAIKINCFELEYKQFFLTRIKVSRNNPTTLREGLIFPEKAY